MIAAQVKRVRMFNYIIHIYYDYTERKIFKFKKPNQTFYNMVWTHQSELRFAVMNQPTNTLKKGLTKLKKIITQLYQDVDSNRTNTQHSMN